MNLQSVKQRFGIIGRSPQLDYALQTATRVADKDLTVLITGESGVGKEVFSKIIHALSPRKHNPFIAINTGAIPEGTINSELFGHEKGAFTGASAERKGYFETVDGGTIFLDEIGEMPLDTQAFLLRVLESGEFLKVGSSKVLKTDVRVVAATNVDLEEKVRQGKFREDLYYRLNTVPIKVPPLRERHEDIHMLFRKFAVDFAEKYKTSTIRLDDQAILLVESYTWPGNIRELKNVAEQVSVLATSKEVDAEMLLGIAPQLRQRNLPVLHPNHQNKSEGSGNFAEREILYKLLFEMKKDLNDLKGLIFELIKDNDLQVQDMASIRPLLERAEGNTSPTPEYRRDDNYAFNHPAMDLNLPDAYPINNPSQNDYDPSQPIIIKRNEKEFDESEIVEESLSLADMEKRMIIKALEKYKGKRKDAASELEISERTLYRKIKDYEIDL